MFPLVQRYHFHVACLRQHASLPKTLLSVLNSTVIQTLLRVLQIKWRLTKIRNGTDTKWLILLLILELQQRYYASCITTIIIIIVITTIYFFRYKWCIKAQRVKMTDINESYISHNDKCFCMTKLYWRISCPISASYNVDVLIKAHR